MWEGHQVWGQGVYGDLWRSVGWEIWGGVPGRCKVFRGWEGQGVSGCQVMRGGQGAWECQGRKEIRKCGVRGCRRAKECGDQGCGDVRG